jgi:hypothetical protein
MMGNCTFSLVRRSLKNDENQWRNKDSHKLKASNAKDLERREVPQNSIPFFHLQLSNATHSLATF